MIVTSEIFSRYPQSAVTSGRVFSDHHIPLLLLFVYIRSVLATCNEPICIPPQKPNVCFINIKRNFNINCRKWYSHDVSNGRTYFHRLISISFCLALCFSLLFAFYLKFFRWVIVVNGISCLTLNKCMGICVWILTKRCVSATHGWSHIDKHKINNNFPWLVFERAYAPVWARFFHIFSITSISFLFRSNSFLVSGPCICVVHHWRNVVHSLSFKSTNKKRMYCIVQTMTKKFYCQEHVIAETFALGYTLLSTKCAKGNIKIVVCCIHLKIISKWILN